MAYSPYAHALYLHSPISSIFKQAPAVSTTVETVWGREPERLAHSDALMNTGKISSPQTAQAEGNPPRTFRVSPGDRTCTFLFIRIPEVKVISPPVINELWMSILQTACLEYTGDV